MQIHLIWLNNKQLWFVSSGVNSPLNNIIKSNNVDRGESVPKAENNSQ